MLLFKRCYLNYFRNYRVCLNDIVMTFVSILLKWNKIKSKFKSFLTFQTHYILLTLIFLKVTAILGGIIYYHSTEKIHGIVTFDQRTSAIISTALFYTVTVMLIVSLLAAALAFPLEIPIIMREV